MSARAPHSAASWFWPSRESTWHNLRRGDVTATSAASLFGVSPYQTPFDLFHRLAGNVVVIIEESDRMKWGKRLQAAIARGICADHGWKIVDSYPFIYARSATCPGMGASPDYVIRDVARPERGLGLLEIKNVDKFVAKDDWTDDEAPVHIEMQVQHQLHACDLAWGVIGGLVGGNDVKVYERERDRAVGDEIAVRITDMHDRVRRNDPPAPDFLADYETIRALYRNAEVGKQIDLGPEGGVDVEAAETLLALMKAENAAGIAKKNAEEDHKRIRAELLVTLGDAERVIHPEWKISATTTHREASTVNYPATTYRNLRVTKIKPKAAK